MSRKLGVEELSALLRASGMRGVRPHVLAAIRNAGRDKALAVALDGLSSVARRLGVVGQYQAIVDCPRVVPFKSDNMVIQSFFAHTQHLHVLLNNGHDRIDVVERMLLAVMHTLVHLRWQEEDPEGHQNYLSSSDRPRAWVEHLRTAGADTAAMILARQLRALEQ